MICYAHPYSAYKRETNENQNRGFRRFIPMLRKEENQADDGLAEERFEEDPGLPDAP